VPGDSAVRVNLAEYFTYEPQRLVGGNKPEVVCLCGSTRFFDLFAEANLYLTVRGKIVLTIGADTRSDSDIDFIEYSMGRSVDEVKHDLDLLHKRKIDMCDTVLVLNRDLYVGQSTTSEIVYAGRQGKRIVYLYEPVPAECVSPPLTHSLLIASAAHL